MASKSQAGWISDFKFALNPKKHISIVSQLDKCLKSNSIRGRGIKMIVLFTK